MRKNSMKNLRVNEEVQHELSSIIRELKDPRIAMMTTVTEVNVATDLKTCKAYISVLGDEQSKKDTMEGLRSAAGFIRRELAHSLNMRNTPEITFKLDTSIERGVEMSHLIDEVMQKDRQSEIRSEEDDYADEN
ncbi:MAG: 30S ribosome-binding factor RbfA [Lachnospiraceae bacterium]|nr:30S ribosome-binding factor RbfA [Lachnospiraceae bacterium]